MMFFMDVGCVFVIECLFISLITSSVQAQPRLESGLQDSVVRKGNTVEFVCDLTTVGSYTIYWRYQGQRISSQYLSRNRQIYKDIPQALQQRLSIIGDESQNEFTLRITNVQLTDEGTYSCQYGVPQGRPETVGTAELTVLIPPSTVSPWCSVQPVSGAVGGTVTLHCNSQRGNPTPNITYYRKNEQVAGPATNSIAHSYHLTAQDNGVMFTCILTTPALDEPRNCSVVPLRILPTTTTLPVVSTVEVRQPLQTTVTDGLIVTIEQGTDVVTERVTATQRMTANSDRTREPSLSPVVPILVAVAVLVIITVIVLVIFVWRKKLKRKPHIPIDSKDGLRMRDIEGEYDELTPGQDGPTVGAGLSHDYQDNANVENVFPGTAVGFKPNTRSKANDARSAVETPTGAQDVSLALYAQPDKLKKTRKPEDVTGSEYSTVPMEEPEPAAADFGLVYADLDLQSPGMATVDTEPASASEKTVYAMIRTG